ncbi:MAG: hydroxypyruvate isomerase [Candidatus Latescibacterota bacterium]|jgi:hydroxypyruvate isomerase
MVKQSAAYWCYVGDGKLSPEAFFKTAADMGIGGVEMVPPEQRQLARDHGLEVINHNCGSIENSFNKLKNHADLIQQHKAGIDANAADGIKDLIVFCGNREGQDDAEGLANTIAGYQQITPYAEEKGVVLLFELFNQKDHPDYMGDYTQFGLDLIRAVDSPNLRIVYDIYHMALMKQSIIADIVENLEIMTHLHLAAAAKRNCTADCTEIPYPEIVRAIHGAGYVGYWGQEFVPGEDVKGELQRAFDYINDCAN